MNKEKVITFFWHLLTSPNPFYNFFMINKNATISAESIRKNGYLSLGKIVSDESLKKIKNTIDTIVEQNNSIYNKTNHYHLITDPLLIEEFLNLSNLPQVVQVAETYFKRKVYLSDVDSRRIVPISMENVASNGLSSSNWHRDTRGRQLKLMIYLTDVSEEDSNFSFYPNTHNNVTYGFDESRFNEGFCKSEPIEWYGKAGEAMMFDTNIIHRLRRKNLGRTRDSVTFYYTPGQQLRNIKINNILISKKDHKFYYGAPFWSKRNS